METPSFSRVEALESRIAPATITVDFSGGNLVLTGDNGDTAFSIEALDDTTFRLSGGLGTEFKLGSDPATSDLQLTGKIKSLNVTLGTGADNFDIIGLNVGGDISIDAGSGTNTLELVALNSKGSLEVTGGDGTDDVILGTGAVIVRKNLNVDLGDGDNRFRSVCVVAQVGGNLTFTGGANNDVVELVDGKLVVGRNAEFTFGAGNAALTMQSGRIFVGRDFLFDSSETITGQSSILSMDAVLLDVGGTLTYRDGAASSFAANLIPATFSINRFVAVTGAGNYSVGFSGQTDIRSIEVDASEADSGAFSINGTASATPLTVNLTGGASSDAFNLNRSGGKALSITADLGAGINQSNLSLVTAGVKGISITGGDGADTVIGQFTSTTFSAGLSLQNGNGENATELRFANVKMKGIVNVTNGSAPGNATLIEGKNTELGGIEYTTAAATSALTVRGPDLTIKGALQVTGGSGNDSVSLDGLSKVGKGIVLDLGDGSNVLSANNLAGLIAKSVTVTGGSGNDSILLQGNGNIGAVQVDLGAGSNNLTMAGGIGALVTRSVDFVSASAAAESESLILIRLQVLGKLNAEFGAADSVFQIDDTVIGSTLTVDTGAGNDTLNIDNITNDFGLGVILAKPVVIVLGDGNDTLRLGGSDIPSQFVVTRSKFRADGGPGTNNVISGPNNDFAKDPELINLTPL